MEWGAIGSSRDVRDVVEPRAGVVRAVGVEHWTVREPGTDFGLFGVPIVHPEYLGVALIEELNETGVVERDSALAVPSENIQVLSDELLRKSEVVGRVGNLLDRNRLAEGCQSGEDEDDESNHVDRSKMCWKAVEGCEEERQVMSVCRYTGWWAVE